MSLIQSLRRAHQCGLTAIVLCFASFTTSLATDAPVRVLVHGKHVANNLVYSYTVVNAALEKFGNVTIGSSFSAERGYQVPQLDKLPVGWKYGREGETGVEIILDSASTTQPSGWAAQVFGQQDHGYYYLRWYVPFESTATGILKGQTLSGFSVTVPKGNEPDRLLVPGTGDAYLNGGFEVGYREGWNTFKEFYGSIERQDTTGPVTTVSLWPATVTATGGLVSVSATLTVRDDYDPAPEIKLESIVANEQVGGSDVVGAALGSDDRSFQLLAKSGRTYSVTYSATDGTGNKTTASATVTVQ
jgi:hypothetical protein